MVRCFEDDNITHVSNKIDPLDDIETINTELVLSDIELLEKLKSGLEKQAKKGDKDAKIKITAAEKLLNHLGKGEPAITIENLAEIKSNSSEFNLITFKPTIYVCTVSYTHLRAHET